MYPIQTQDNLFHDGDGVTELGTIVTAEWLNDVQQSLLAVLAAAQKAPAKNNHNLLRDSINELIKRGIPNGSLTTKGVVRLSSAINNNAEDLAATPKAVMDALAAAMAGNLTLHGALGSKNLNDLIGPLHYGIHHQVANASATSDLNYPAQKAGTLLVLPSAYSGVQLYIPFDMSLIYIRHQAGTNGVMSPWRSIGEVEDTLASTNTTTALSAAQGKVLNDAKADVSTIITAGNGLTGGGTLAANRALALGTPTKITATSTNIVTSTSHTHELDNSVLVPSGAIIFVAGDSLPTGYLKANGAAVSRTTYAALFAAIGTRYGAGNGSTTFNLPDLRGEFVRGWDDGRGVDAGRELGTHQLDALQNHMHGTLPRAQQNNSGQNLARGAGGEWGTETMGVTSSARTAWETRPRNISLMAVIKI